MSISATLQQAAAEKAKLEQDAHIAKVNDAFNKITDELPALLKEIAEVARLRVTPATGLMGYFKNAAANSKKREWKREQKLGIDMPSTGLEEENFLPEGLEKFSGYRRLREYCARPEVDIRLHFAIDHDSLRLRICPAESFSTSTVQHPPKLDCFADIDFDALPDPPVVYSIPEFLAKNAATLAPPQVESKIAVMSPLKLKG